MTDITISGNSCSIDCWASRWDTNNYSLTIETWMKKSDLQSLRDSITPQAVGELYKILGKPTYYDRTWTASNTLTVSVDTSKYLSYMRDDTTIYVKNISDKPLPGASGWINVKIEAVLSGNTDL